VACSRHLLQALHLLHMHVLALPTFIALDLAAVLAARADSMAVRAKAKALRFRDGAGMDCGFVRENRCFPHDAWKGYDLVR
jgi:hypothetical protein